jgi:hypothetical protein
MAIDATHLFDVATGVAIHTNMQLHHLSGADSDTRVRFVRDLDLQPPRRGSTSSQGLAVGECVSEI